ncbi:sigma-70 family RNA polymerase sigma factor [Spirosoma sp.]|uniref:RNA polymerase sigma factor n=1 Tax=Spirosoma sp. TaxID=1899569 RepID=UPI00262A90F8|nr:sigma-70 family RNA polymerase sigma factor [Spirosoma sp.]MCX6214614.1 sigma-70 family RNA polymerase sigma factor [Spirosoma sp.]
MPQLIPTETIIANLRRGEDVNGVTRYLYATYSRSIKGYIRKLGGLPDDAEDIVQEVMITFLHQIVNGQFELREQTDLGAYLIGITRRKWLKKMESETRRRERQHWFATGSDDPQTPETIVLETDYQSRAWAYFQQLGETCRQVLTAFYQDEQSLEDIAAQYELGSVGAVKMRKFRCIQKLLKLADV